jgi:membrane protein YqaA with SNARE-associated domain
MRVTVPRKWKIFSLLVIASGLVSVAVLKWAPPYQGLVWLYVYSIPSHVYISILPHEPVLLYIGKLYNIVLVVIAAGLGTVVAGFIDYETLGPALKHRTIKNLYHDKKFYRKAVELFYKAPFWVIVVAAFTPIPYYPIKLLSIASDYPEGKYLGALTVGRIPRYFLLAYAGLALHVPNWVLMVLFIALLIMAFAKRGARLLKTGAAKILKHWKGTTENEAFQ